MATPKYLYRTSDGYRFTRQPDGTYTMDKSRMGRKWKYSYNSLKLLGFVEDLRECEIVVYESDNDGHGDVD